MFRLNCSAICFLLMCLLLLTHLSFIDAAPRPQTSAVDAIAAASEDEDLDTGAIVDEEKDDLQGSASLGYGYYSYPYIGSYYGGYYPYYHSYDYGLGYPYYGYYGYHGHGYHGHFF